MEHEQQNDPGAPGSAVKNQPSSKSDPTPPPRKLRRELTDAAADEWPGVYELGGES